MTQFLLRCLLLFALATAQQGAEPASSTNDRVVFVCEHGAAKSVIAASYFNKLAQERGLPQRAIARGTQPDDAYSAATVKGLESDGVPLEKGKPTMVTEADVAKSARVITLGCKLPAAVSGASKVEDWDAIPSVSANYPAARDAIKKRVEQLVEEMGARKKP